MARAAAGEAVGNRQSETAEASGDQVALGRDRHRSQTVVDNEPLVVLHGHDQLADVLGLRHGAERVRDPRGREHAMRQRTQARTLPDR